jgi:hypothetical protein
MFFSCKEEVQKYMDRFLEQERKRERRKQEIERWKADKVPILINKKRFFINL